MNLQNEQPAAWADTTIEGTDKVLVTLDPNTRGFLANGTRYFIEDNDLTLARFQQKNKMDIAFGFGMSYDSLFTKLNDAYAAGNKQKMADCFFILGNLIRSIGFIEENKVAAVELCTLFINAEGEDRRVYDPVQNARKIEDWTKEGIGVSFFLRLAILLVAGLPKHLKDAFQSISEKEVPFHMSPNISPE